MKGTTSGKNPPTTTPQSAKELNHTLVTKQPQDSLVTHANCTSLYATVNTLVDEEGNVLLVFTSEEHPDTAQMSSQACGVHITSQSRAIFCCAIRA